MLKEYSGYFYFGLALNIVIRSKALTAEEKIYLKHWPLLFK